MTAKIKKYTSVKRMPGTIENWLYSRGDRDRRDIMKDAKGLYVLMRNGRYKEDYEVYLPEDLT